MDEIEELEHVKKAAGVAIGLVSLRDRPYFLVLGVEEEDLPLVGINIVSGTAFSQEDEVIVGEIAAKELDVEVGERLSFGEEEFTVTGIFETGNPYFDKGAVIPLRKLQNMMKLEGYVMMIYVDLEEGTDIEEGCWLIEEMYPDLVTIKSVAEFSEVDRSLEIMSSLSQGVSLLAILIGGLGVMNTMMMSVYERTREIGVLRALGWKRRRVLAMILGESIVLCLFSILLGTLLGLIAIKLLMLSPIIRGFFEPMWATDIFVNSFIVAFTVGLIGGLYPAYRACKLSPAEALRYE